MCAYANYVRDPQIFINSGRLSPLSSFTVPENTSRAMQILSWQLAFVSLVRPLSFVNGAALLNNSSLPASILQPQHLTNSTLSTEIIPTGFKLILEEPARGPELQVVLCLEIAIQIVGKHLAPQEFNERMQAHSWILAGVVFSISTQGVPGNSIQRRFVIWGIYQALTQVEDRESFRSVIYKLEWRGDAVGYLAIYPKHLPILGFPSNLAGMTQIEPPLSSIRGDSNGSVSPYLSSSENEGVHFQFVILDPHQSLDLHGALVNVLGALCDAAQWPKNKVVPNLYQIRAGISGIEIIILPRNILNYKWLIQALTTVLPALALLKKLAPFRADVWLGKLNLGQILMRPHVVVSDTSNAFIEASFNVSVGSATSFEK